MKFLCRIHMHYQSIKTVFIEHCGIFRRCEADTIRHWQSTMEPELRAKLKQPLLVSSQAAL